MKRLIAFAIVSLALAIGMTGCANSRLRSNNPKNVVITTAAMTALIILSASYACGDCTFGGDDHKTQR